MSLFTPSAGPHKHFNDHYLQSKFETVRALCERAVPQLCATLFVRRNLNPDSVGPVRSQVTTGKSENARALRGVMRLTRDSYDGIAFYADNMCEEFLRVDPSPRPLDAIIASSMCELKAYFDKEIEHTVRYGEDFVHVLAESTEDECNDITTQLFTMPCFSKRLTVLTKEVLDPFLEESRRTMETMATSWDAYASTMIRNPRDLVKMFSRCSEPEQKKLADTLFDMQPVWEHVEYIITSLMDDHQARLEEIANKMPDTESLVELLQAGLADPATSAELTRAMVEHPAVSQHIFDQSRAAVLHHHETILAPQINMKIEQEVRLRIAEMLDGGAGGTAAGALPPWSVPATAHAQPWGPEIKPVPVAAPFALLKSDSFGMTPQGAKRLASTGSSLGGDPEAAGDSMFTFNT